MNIIIAQPPNFEEIAEVFPIVKQRNNVIFTYGDNIYNPDNMQITRALHEHECVHSCRQQLTGAADWWRKYLRDVEFRFDEELLAHRREYAEFSQGKAGRNQRRAALKIIARRLSSPLYGAMVSYGEAKRLITR